MPSKNKNQLNGFWLFATNSKQRLKAQGLRIDTNEALLQLASPLWKQLGTFEKKQWDERAKAERKQQKSQHGDMGRMDNVGNIIGTRKDPVEEARKRRERELDLVTSQWQGKDLTQERFYFINFQEICEINGEIWLPRELAMVEYSLKKGLTKVYHQFIWPVEIPKGFAHAANMFSEEYHKIPTEKMDDYDDSDNFPLIWRKMLEVVKDGVKDGVYPPLYCLTIDYNKTKYMSDWMWDAGQDTQHRENPLGKIYSIGEMVSALLTASGNPDAQQIQSTAITSKLDGSQWEYIPDTTCKFHEEQDVSRCCALAVVKRFAYTISDMVVPHYGVELSEHHVPVVEEKTRVTARLLPPQTFPAFRRPQARGLSRLSGSRDSTFPASSGYSAESPYKHTQKYSQMAQARSSDEEEDRKLMPSHTPFALGPRSKGAGDSTPVWHMGPTTKEYDTSDWPQLGAASSRKPPPREPSPEDNALQSQVQRMSLSDLAFDWTKSGGRGLTTAHNASSEIQTTGREAPPLAAKSDFQHSAPLAAKPVLGVGRGALPPQGARQEAAAPAYLGVGRGMPPPLGVGRGSGPPLAVGRASGPPLGVGRGSGPPLGVGRGSGPPLAVGSGLAPRGGIPEGQGRVVPPPGLSDQFGMDSDDDDFEPFNRAVSASSGVSSANRPVGVGRGSMGHRKDHPSVGRGRRPGNIVG